MSSYSDSDSAAHGSDAEVGAADAALPALVSARRNRSGKGLFHEPAFLVALIVVVAVLGIFVLYPMIRVLVFPNGGDYATVLSDPRYMRAALDSLLMLVLSTGSATILGFVFAYALSRPDMPFKRTFRAISILPLFSPPFVVAFAYLMMFGRNGIISHGLFGVRYNILGWHGLWLSETISFFPVATMAIKAVLESIPQSLMQAARNLGASGFARFRSVTLPLAASGIAGAALLVAILVLADFGNPIMIAGDFSVLATEAWLRVTGWADVNGAAVLCTLLLIPSLIIFVVQRLWIRGKSFVTIGGKISGFEAERTPFPEKAILVCVCGIVSLFVVLVYAALVLGALVNGWGFDWTPTLRWFGELADQGGQLLRSIVFSILSGAISAVFAMFAAYLVVSKKTVFRPFIDFVSMLPAALPGVFIGIGYSIAFNRPPLDLYGTGAIVVLSLVFWNVSAGYQTGVEGLRQISPTLGEAASNMGAGSMRIFADVHFRLMLESFFSAFVVGFIRSVTTLSVIVFLQTASNSVATFTIMNLINDGYYGKAAALSSVLLLLSFLIIGLVRLSMGRRARPLNF